MENNTCYLCSGKKSQLVEGCCRDLPEVGIIKCTECGLIFLDSFKHITENFYSESLMHEDPLSATTELESEQDKQRRISFCSPIINNKDVLDFGSGYPGFLIKAKKTARSVTGLEPEKKYHPVYRGHDIDVYNGIEEIEVGKKFDVITIFHVLEHLVDPRKILMSLGKNLSKTGKIIIEVPNADDALLKLYKNKGFQNFFWSCHLYLFNTQTLSHLIKQAGFKIDYIKQIQRYSLSNHLYWLQNNKPGGHRKWSYIESDLLKAEYEKCLASLGMCDTIIAQIHI